MNRTWGIALVGLLAGCWLGDAALMAAEDTRAGLVTTVMGKVEVRHTSAPAAQTVTIKDDVYHGDTLSPSKIGLAKGALG